MNELKFPIYLDHHATTPLDPRVLEEMLPYFTKKFGNASSLDHPYGYDASMAVENSREKIAKIINARQNEIIFTSGATESDNLALIGTMEKYRERGDHLITCVTEHKAILDTARRLERLGKNVTYLDVNEYGEIDIELLKKSITAKTVMISIMAANNEIGTIADIERIGKIAHENNVIFHTDAAQAVGHIPIDVEKMNIDLMSMSSHKIYGPKGIGALYIRSMKPRVKPEPIIFGGGQERNIRPGTLNVPGIVGFGKALEIASKEMDSENEMFQEWTTKMLQAFQEAGGKLNGHPAKRIVHNLNIFFRGIESKAVINSISKKVAISAGSACTTQTVEPSHVLLALGFDEERSHSSIRIGVGRFNTTEEIDFATSEIISVVENITKIKV